MILGKRKPPTDRAIQVAQFSRARASVLSEVTAYMSEENVMCKVEIKDVSITGRQNIRLDMLAAMITSFACALGLRDHGFLSRLGVAICVLMPGVGRISTDGEEKDDGTNHQ